MKAICPGHDGPVEVALTLSDFQTTVKTVLFYCPVCEEDIELNAESFNQYEQTLKEFYKDGYF